MADKQVDRRDEERRSRELALQLIQLRRRLADLAGEIARTEDQSAVVHDEVARSSSSLAPGAAVTADEARRRADHERAVQRRLSAPPNPRRAAESPLDPTREPG
jgi:hypothetical protein